MIKTQYINLDMTPSGVMPVLYCSQYDIGRPLGMVVYNGGEAVDLDTYTCTIEATRTDGTAITAAVTTDDNIGAFVTTATMTNQADQYPAKLVLFDSNSRRVASLAFVMCVTPKTMDENAESIQEDESLYQQFTGTVQTIIAEIREDLEAEIDNREAAVSAEASARQAADQSIQNNIALRLSMGSTAPEILCVNAELSIHKTVEGVTTYYGVQRLVGESYYTTYVALQGGCYNSTTERFVLAVTDANFVNAILVELDSTYAVVRRSSPLPLGHANGLAYNPTTNMIYVATGSTGTNTGKIVAVNANTLAVSSTQTMGHVSWFIAYDPINNVFYDIDNDGYLNKYGSDWTRLSSVLLNLEYQGSGFIGGNGLAVYNGRPYYLGYIRDAADAEYKGIFICTFDDSGNIASIGRYQLSANTDEPENICMVGNVGHIFAGNTWFRIYNLYIDPLEIIETNTNYFGRGERIPLNTDLNDLTIEGKYSCASGTSAATLANVPYTGSGFSMLVSHQTWLGIRQEIQYSTGDIYIRYLNASGTWSDWQKLAAISDVTTLSETVSVPNSTSTITQTVRIPVGKIIILTAVADFPSNATGIRMLQLFNQWVASVPAVNGDATRLTGTTIWSNMGGTEAAYTNIRVLQSSGSAMNVTTTIHYVIM